MGEPAVKRRRRYLDTAIEFRRMAAQAPSPEVQQSLMQLAVLYEELAEYALAAERTEKTLTEKVEGTDA